MKRSIFLSFILAVLIVSCNSTYKASSYDDVYYSPASDKSKSIASSGDSDLEILKSSNYSESSKHDVSLDNDSYFVPSDNSNPEESAYASRLSRFYGDLDVDDYYDEVYTETVAPSSSTYVIVDPYYVSPAVSFSFGYNYNPWGWNSWDPWFSSWYSPWYYPYYTPYPSWGYPSWGYPPYYPPCCGGNGGSGTGGNSGVTYGKRDGYNSDGATASGSSRPLNGTNSYSNGSTISDNSSLSSSATRPNVNSITNTTQQANSQSVKPNGNGNDRPLTRYESATTSTSNRDGKIVKYERPSTTTTTTTTTRNGNEYSRYRNAAATTINSRPTTTTATTRPTTTYRPTTSTTTTRPTTTSRPTTTIDRSRTSSRPAQTYSRPNNNSPSKSYTPSSSGSYSPSRSSSPSRSTGGGSTGGGSSRGGGGTSTPRR